MSAAKTKKSLEGEIISDKLNKTRTVIVSSLKKHPVYGKYINSRKKFLVHDESNNSKIGDKVKISETRPLSSRKRWEVVEILNKAQ